MVIELERTYLLKVIPPDLHKYSHKELLDIYIPEGDKHPILRIRKNGNSYELTKKIPKTKDITEYTEQTIPLTHEEFGELSTIKGKRIRKIRYAYTVENRVCEIDVFKDNLEGLVSIDFEFPTIAEKEKFTPPDFCLAEISQEKTLAGGFLAGKSYEDIKRVLEKYHYKSLIFDF